VADFLYDARSASIIYVVSINFPYWPYDKEREFMLSSSIDHSKSATIFLFDFQIPVASPLQPV